MYTIYVLDFNEGEGYLCFLFFPTTLMQVGAIAVHYWRIYCPEWGHPSADQGSGCCCILFREWHQVLHVIARSEDGPGFRWKFQGAGSNLLADPREQLFATHLHCTGVQLKPVICSIFPVWESI